MAVNMVKNVGYSAGWVGQEYLTIPGSAYNRVILHSTPETALEAARATWPNIADQLEVCYVTAVYHPGVTVTNRAYRIVR